MKYLMLFENFESDDILLDIKDRLQYFEDDLDLYVRDRFLRGDLEIFISEKPPQGFSRSTDSIGRFRFDKNFKMTLDLLIKYCQQNDLKFSIQLWYKGRQVINVDGRGETMTFDYRRSDYTYVTKEIKHITEIPTDRWVNLIKIIILNKKEN